MLLAQREGSVACYLVLTWADKLYLCDLISTASSHDGHRFGRLPCLFCDDLFRNLITG